MANLVAFRRLALVEQEQRHRALIGRAVSLRGAVRAIQTAQTFRVALQGLGDAGAWGGDRERRTHPHLASLVLGGRAAIVPALVAARVEPLLRMKLMPFKERSRERRLSA